MKTYTVTFSTTQEVNAKDEKQAVEFACEDAEIDNLNQYNVIVEDTDEVVERLHLRKS